MLVMRVWAAWGASAIVSLAGCTGASDAPEGGAADAGVGLDAAARDASPSIDANAIDASADAGLDTNTRDALSSTDAVVDAGAICPAGGACTLHDGGVGACCDGTCVDTTSDDANCDHCGLHCRFGMSCVQGLCLYRACLAADGTRASPAGNFVAGCVLADGTSIGYCCGDICHARTDFDADPANCGGCDLACPPGQTCTGGRCGPAGIGCGSPGPPCAAGRTCWDGIACLPSSCAGQPDETSCTLASFHAYVGTCCAGSCIDPTGDRANCGTCGHACVAGTTCEYGVCSPLSACAEPGTTGAECVLGSGAIGRCCGARCVDLTADAQNCGSCSVFCFGGASCMRVGPHPTDGACVRMTDGGLTTPHCASDADCPATTQCDPGSSDCRRLDCTGVADGSSCRPPGFSSIGICCAGACVDPTRDPNCGACGVSCASGVCAVVSNVPFRPIVTCLPALTTSPDCSGAGGCTAREACVGGVCVARSCASGSPFRMIQDRRSSLCLAASGAAGVCVDNFTGSLDCVDFANDPMRCGASPGSTACAAGQRCVRGRCTP